MLRVTPSQSANAAIKYFDEGLKRDDYYLKGEAVKANWLGQGAERLGLSGNVERDDFVLDNSRNSLRTGSARAKDGRRILRLR